MSRAPFLSSSDLSVNRKLAALLVHKYKREACFWKDVLPTATRAATPHGARNDTYEQ